METAPLLTEQMRAATREIHGISGQRVQLESIIKTHKNHEAFIGLYKIFDEIARADNIAKDLQFYLGEEWSTRYQPTQATQDYVKYVNRLNLTVFYLVIDFVVFCSRYLKLLDKKNPTLILPYCYHMYMAMLVGGVMIKNMVKRSFALPEGQGLNCFAFHVDSNKAFRNTIKDAINAVPHDEKTKKLLLSESVACFKMNNQIVRSLDGAGNHVMKLILKWIVIIGLILATFFAFTRGS
ncbi:unnamed protein product [Peronospora destructor]|uniref:Heme oxygenase n=1 Tax=Peronospora destructor TaxID=86335 RepID=A0AAV0UJ58_9STRA|nr:unnamed protein product [Peronospora destructor]